MDSTRGSMPPPSRGSLSALNNSQHRPDALSSYFGNYNYSSPAMPNTNYFPSSSAFVQDEDLSVPDSWESEIADESLDSTTITDCFDENVASTPDLSTKKDSFSGVAAQPFVRSVALYASPPQARLDESVASEVIDFEKKTFDWGDSDDDEWEAPTPMFAKPQPVKAETQTETVAIDFNAPISWSDDEDDDWVAPAPMYSQPLRKVDDETDTVILNDDTDDEADEDDYIPVPLPPRRQTGYPSFDALYQEGRVNVPTWSRALIQTPLFFRDDPCLKHQTYSRYHEIEERYYNVSRWTGQEKILREVIYSNAPDRGLSDGDSRQSGIHLKRARTDKSDFLADQRREIEIKMDAPVPEPLELPRELFIEPLHRLPPFRKPLALAFAPNGPSSWQLVDSTPLFLKDNSAFNPVQVKLAEQMWKGCLRSGDSEFFGAEDCLRECYSAAGLHQRVLIDLDHDPVTTYNGTPARLPLTQMPPFFVDPQKYLEMIYRLPGWETLGITAATKNAMLCESAEDTVARWQGVLEQERESINYGRLRDDRLQVIPPESLHAIMYDEFGCFLANSGPWAVSDENLAVPAPSPPAELRNPFDTFDMTSLARMSINESWEQDSASSQDLSSPVDDLSSQSSVDIGEITNYCAGTDTDDADENKTMTRYEDLGPDLELGHYQSMDILHDSKEITTSLSDETSSTHISSDSTASISDTEELSELASDTDDSQSLPVRSPPYSVMHNDRLWRVRSLASPIVSAETVVGQISLTSAAVISRPTIQSSASSSTWRRCWSSCARFLGFYSR